MELKVHYSVHKSPPPDPALSQNQSAPSHPIPLTATSYTGEKIKDYNTKCIVYLNAYTMCNKITAQEHPKYTGRRTS
jgi:hypothetical protein